MNKSLIYFRGCTARLKQTNISKATQHLLDLANVNYTLLEDEKCCGSVLLRTGFIEDAQELINENTKKFKDNTIITSCAGCYKTLKGDYEGIDVVHISQLLDKLIKEGKINPKKRDLLVTYHDPCHLSRNIKVYEQPRNVINSVASLVEMESHHQNSLCCGAGGGVKSAYPEIAYEMSIERLKQAKDTNAEKLITTCPFCKTNLENEDIEVLDLCEFLIGELDEGE